MSRVLRVGILGCANIAEKFLIPAFQSSKEYSIVGIASRSQKSAQRLAKKFSITPFDSYDSLLNSNLLDVIYIPLPNSLHFDWIKKALNKNLHVLVEKSMACSFNDVSELTNLAKLKKLVIVENFQFRFHSQLSYIQQLIETGKIGDIRHIRSCFGFPPFPDSENIRYKKELGGGALLDAGAYPLKIAQIFMGHNIEVMCSQLFIDPVYDVDTYGSFTLSDIDSEISAQCAFGFDNYYQCNIEFWGSKGRIIANRIFTAPPGVNPTILIETADKEESISLCSDDHFKGVLKHLYNLIKKPESIDVYQENEQNLYQARLLEKIKEKSL
jgi:dTDP-3,4-didehydro-2,6-dideoxy-alpha-D-glucose 3-reductase